MLAKLPAQQKNLGQKATQQKRLSNKLSYPQFFKRGSKGKQQLRAAKARG
jgi:hypothetical protein